MLGSGGKRGGGGRGGGGGGDGGGEEGLCGGENCSSCSCVAAGSGIIETAFFANVLGARASANNITAASPKRTAKVAAHLRSARRMDSGSSRGCWS